MKTKFLPLFIFIFTITCTTIHAQADQVSVVRNDDGFTLIANGEPIMLNGMNWDYFPVGSTNPSYNFWGQPDDFIKAALDAEMSMLQNMGVNVIRQYLGVKPKWVQYIYEKYGIWTMINTTFGRYGLTLDGTYVPNTEYGDPKVREVLIAESKKMVEDFKDTPGILLYMLGNENNYGLFWDGAETEDVPMEDRKSTVRARSMYEVFNQAAVAMKELDTSHPIAICNGDLLFMDIIVEECQDIDIFGTNVYRGISFGDAFQRTLDEYDRPILFAEFGADAFNAIENEEDQHSQAYYMVGNWKEIYENAAGLGKAGNSLGGFTFQFSDGWWKYGQTKNLDIHDNNASWENGGYTQDHIVGENNMNEEWFGVCAKGPTNFRGLYDLYPRAAYYGLQEAHQLNPYNEGVTLESIEEHFSRIDLMDAVLKARGDKAALAVDKLKKVRISGLRADLSTFNTGGERISTPKEADPTDLSKFPDETGFDHMQSYFLEVEANPSESVKANVSVNVLGNVAQNPINEIFYEKRGRPRAVNTDNGNLVLPSIDRVQIYQADFLWKGKHFDLNGFYRTGHYHWGYEGDFFGLYPEANYGPNIDIYNGTAPFGFEMEGKKSLKGLKVAFGPELWWGANPAILVKYSKKLGPFDVTGIFHEDIDDAPAAVSSFAVPLPRNRKATLHLETKVGKLGVELGGIWAGQPLNGRMFQVVEETDEGYIAYQDEIQTKDNWGGKVKLTYSAGPVNWYGQAAALGLVAITGADQTQTFAGWRLKDGGNGNQYHILSGFTYSIGKFQFAPNFLWQKPIEGPIPIDVIAPGRPRNILDDPFAVRSNRETVAGELLITYDPTPGTWMYEWNNDMVEEAGLAVSAGFVYRHHPTIQDAAIGILGDGRTLFAFPGSAPAQDLWEVNTRIVSKLSPDFGFIVNLLAGNAQANGSDPRLIKRYGGDLRMIYKNTKLTAMIKRNDWGPFDYHRDFNLTFPTQLMFDLSTSVGKQSWLNMPDTRMGIRATWRSLDQYSPRYCPTKGIDLTGEHVCDPEALGFPNGNEWEIRTYFQINLFN
jgi:hypothetical protein